MTTPADVVRIDPDSGHRMIWCPGCVCIHALDERWTITGDLQSPTFSPSLMERSGHYVTGETPDQCDHCRDAAAEDRPTHCRRCHSYIRSGKIEYLSDTTHALAGQTVTLPPFAVAMATF